jgi:hypothetical protein
MLPQPRSTEGGSKLIGGKEMGELVNFPIALDSDLGRELIVDLCRFSEQILDEKFICRKYRLPDTFWESLGSDDELVLKIENEKRRRIADGSSKRELAQKYVVSGPGVLSGIMNDPDANAKHRIDASKTLNDFASTGAEAAAAAARFEIVINLSADTQGGEVIEHYSKSIKVDAHDVAPLNDSAPQDVVAAITKNDDHG